MGHCKPAFSFFLSIKARGSNPCRRTGDADKTWQAWSGSEKRFAIWKGTFSKVFYRDEGQRRENRALRPVLIFLLAKSKAVPGCTFPFRQSV
jgi:hypothetical protein